MLFIVHASALRERASEFHVLMFDQWLPVPQGREFIASNPNPNFHVLLFHRAATLLRPILGELGALPVSAMVGAHACVYVCLRMCVCVCVGSRTLF